VEELDSKLSTLRHILVGREREEIARLRRQLGDPGVRSAEIAALLPDSIRLAVRTDTRIEESSVPLVEEALRRSVQQDPKVAAGILFPVMSPAIWKAVSSAVHGMMESLNEALDRNFTLQGLQWRWEAFRSGRSLAEVALRQSLLYRVEQVYLIHLETGVLLQFAGAEDETSERELVSAMLTAIQDFVRDSFSVEQDQELQTLRVGEREIWIERSPNALLAAVVIGSPRSTQVRQAMRETLAAVQQTHWEELEGFEGDTNSFATCQPKLRACLQEEVQPKRAAKPIAAYVLGSIALVAVIAWGLVAWAARERVLGYVEQLRNEPGLVVLSTQRRDGRYHVALLRDPHSADPETLLAEHQLSSDQIVFDSKPFLSLDAEMVVRRAGELLHPPSTVSMQADEGVLSLAGLVDSEWLEKTRRDALGVPGVTAVDTEKLAVQPEPAWELLRQDVERIQVVFGSGSVVPSSDQQAQLDLATVKLNELFAWRRIGGRVTVQVLGSADTKGRPEQNRELSRQRAHSVYAHLIEAGISPEHLQVAVAKVPDTTSQKEKRRVVFRVLAPDG
jgi:OOP family OmpA-OmpF porin